MAAGSKEDLKSEDVRKTYRYLRMGMIGAVVLLAVSIGIERSKVPCLQTSLSAYYYTPVRAIFVGSLVAIGLALIVYKGRSDWEDFFLNIAGVLAPVVAVAPTTDVGRCWSVRPERFPLREDGSLARWVVANIENNIYPVLLIGGFVALGIMLLTAIVATRRERRSAKDGSGQGQATERDRKARRRRLRRRWLPPILSFVFLLVGWFLIEFWDDFNTKAHGWAAVILISFLGFAIIAQALDLRPNEGDQWRKRDKRLFWVYMVTVALMALGGILIWLTRVFGEHTVFALEAYEIGLFAGYWIVETKVKWHEDVVDPQPVGAQTINREVRARE
jgi:putative Mn2+ efflux pump MntP